MCNRSANSEGFDVLPFLAAPAAAAAAGKTARLPPAAQAEALAEDGAALAPPEIDDASRSAAIGESRNR